MIMVFYFWSDCLIVVKDNKIMNYYMVYWFMVVFYSSDVLFLLGFYSFDVRYINIKKRF